MLSLLKSLLPIALSLLVLMPATFAAKSTKVAEDLSLSAAAAILIEGSTGRVIYDKDADKRNFPASTTKMMTSILALENVGERSVVTISPNAAATESSSMGLQPFEQIDMLNLNTGMMLVSDNGAAVAIAEHIGGDMQNFAAMMNAKARDIGCVNTHFVNPNGLPNDNHYSTAHDMARIAAYCMKNPRFRKIVLTQSSPIRLIFPYTKKIFVHNTNLLLGSYDGTIGIKTGWTNKAGGCLAAAAKRDGVTLIAVVLQSATTDSRFDDARKLFDYGFAHVRMRRGIVKERASVGIWVRNGTNYRVSAGPVEDIDYPLVDGETAAHYTWEYDVPRFLDAPAMKGDKVGSLILKYDGEPISSVDVTLRETVPQGFSLSSYFLVGLLSFFAGY